ncbi:MAG: NAD(P)H-hydrate dehydratase, partial [Planctomycetota bacterium]|nr:NAD(P)H-hydrate dehydratase [Planctomycetota bacterium]
MRRLNDVPKIARLKRDAHKGDCGRVLIVAGSLRMSGAARLAGWGALRGGAGLVTIAVPDVIQSIVAAELPCAMTLPLPAKRGVLTASGVDAARELADAVDVVAVGPGLTTSAAPFLRRFLHGLATPLVLDADALNILALEPQLLAHTTGTRVLTPHPGEAQRLLDEAIADTETERLAAAAALADRHDAVVALKGRGTVVCDGDRYFVCRAGNPGMATGGTGDVLTGVVA